MTTRSPRARTLSSVCNVFRHALFHRSHVLLFSAIHKYSHSGDTESSGRLLSKEHASFSCASAQQWIHSRCLFHHRPNVKTRQSDLPSSPTAATASRERRLVPVWLELVVFRRDMDGLFARSLFADMRHSEKERSSLDIARSPSFCSYIRGGACSWASVLSWFWDYTAPYRLAGLTFRRIREAQALRAAEYVTMRVVASDIPG